MSLVNALYNLQLMKIAGENGVAAYGAVMYVNFIFVATFLGYAIGCARLSATIMVLEITQSLKNLYKKSMSIILVWGVILFGAAQLLAPVLSKIFVGYNTGLYAMTLHGFRVYAIAFLIIGINIFGSSFFTALNNGLISAVISFLRTLMFQVIMVLTLPLWFGINGIWSAISVAEALTLYHDQLHFSSVRKTSIITCKTISFKCNDNIKKRISAMFPQLSEKEASQRYVFYLLKHLLKINIFDPNFFRIEHILIQCLVLVVQRLLYIRHHL